MIVSRFVKVICWVLIVSILNVQLSSVAYAAGSPPQPFEQDRTVASRTPTQVSDDEMPTDDAPPTQPGDIPMVPLVSQDAAYAVGPDLLSDSSPASTAVPTDAVFPQGEASNFTSFVPVGATQPNLQTEPFLAPPAPGQITVAINIPPVAEVDPQYRQEIEGVMKAMGAVSFPVPADFWVALSSHGEKIRQDEAVSRHLKRLAVANGIIGGVLLAGVIAFLMLNNPYVGSLWGLPPIQFPTFQWQQIVGAAGIGAFTLLNSGLLLHNGTRALMRPASRYEPLAAEQNRGKSVGFSVIILPGTTVLAGKALYAYVTTVMGAPTGLIVAGAIGGVVYAGVMLGQSYETLYNGWTKFWRLGKTVVNHKQGNYVEGEDEKNELRLSLGNGFRKILDLTESFALYCKIQLINELIGNEQAKLQAPLKMLEETHAKLHKALDDLKKNSPVFQEVKEKCRMIARYIVFLKDQALVYERLGILLKLHALHNFDSPNAPGPLRNPYHPKWYDAMKTLGAVGGVAATVSIWYGVAFVLNNWLPAIPSEVLGGLASVPLTGYLTKGFSDFTGRVGAAAMGYNPIESEEMIDWTLMTKGSRTKRGLLATMEFMNFARGFFVNLPSSLLGGGGMYSGITPDGAPPVSTNIAPTTIVPSMLAFGAMEHNSSAPRLEGFISRMRAHFAKDGMETLQQWVADYYGMTNQWIVGLDGKFAVTLQAYMEQKPEDWFKGSIFADAVTQAKAFVADPKLQEELKKACSESVVPAPAPAAEKRSAKQRVKDFCSRFSWRRSKSDVKPEAGTRSSLEQPFLDPDEKEETY